MQIFLLLSSYDRFGTYGIARWMKLNEREEQ